jgi:uncharacterized protein
MFARHFIDSLDFARQGKELRGEIPVTEMSRLQDLLAAPDGVVDFVLRGMVGRKNEPLLELTLEGTCQLRCQRCLQGMLYPINAVSHLYLVPENEINDTDALAREEDADLIPVQSHLDVLELIEDEILLGLPLAPKHEFGKCSAAVEHPDHSTGSPFAALNRMKNG